MYGLVRKLFFVFLVVVVVGFALRNYGLKYGLEYQLGQSSGFASHVEAVDFSNFNPPRLTGFDLVLDNPSPFSPKQAVVIDRFAGTPPVTFWSKPEPRWGSLEVEVDELILVRAPNGDYNLAYLEGFRSPKRPARGQDAKPLIDSLSLSVEQLTFYDYMGHRINDPIQPQAIPINLRGAQYYDVTDLGELQRLIVQETLRRTREPNLSDARQYFRVEAAVPPPR